MKTIKRTVIAAVIALSIGTAGAQIDYDARNKTTIAVLNIDTKGIVHDPASISYMVRLEMEKANVFTVMDKYDIADIVEKNNVDISKCYGKSCLVSVGKILKADKMLSGSIERFGEKIVITLRIIDVKTGEVENSDAMEYLNLQPEVQKMIEISVKNLLDIENDPNLVNLLVDYEAPISSPKTTLRLSGPRMGASIVIGPAAKRLLDSKDYGGYEMFPVMSQFGYQYETQYLSAGNFQALIEFVGMIGGLESGQVIPTLAFMNGFRGSKSGWEFGFGPVFKIVKVGRGYYDSAEGGDGEWHLQSEWDADPDNFENGQIILNPNQLQDLPDRRGDIQFSTSLVLAIGKTFKSGYLNVPVNIYVIPNKKGTIVGVSFGFNINKKKRNI